MWPSLAGQGLCPVPSSLLPLECLLYQEVGRAHLRGSQGVPATQWALADMFVSDSLILLFPGCKFRIRMGL